MTHTAYMHYFGLPTSGYLSVVLWSLTFPHRTHKVRINTKITWTLTKYEASWLFIRALPGMCGYVQHPGLLPTLFTYPHVLTLLTNISVLNIIKVPLASVIRLSLNYPHDPDKARMNNHQALYLVSIRLIFVF